MDTVFLNYQASTSISMANRGLAYGDGCFTTIKTVGGKAELLSYHIQRLQSDAERLDLPLVDWSQLQQFLADLSQTLIKKIEKNTIDGLSESLINDSAVIKVMLLRSGISRGYAPPVNASTEIIISIHPYPEHYTCRPHKPLDLGVAEIKLASQPALAGIKHLNRLEQVLAKIELEKTGHDDLILLSENKQIVEATASNVFWLKDDVWYCPLLSKSGVKGVMHTFICDYLISKQEKLTNGSYSIDMLLLADSVFICNSLMHIQPVGTLSYQGQVASFNTKPCINLDTLITSAIQSI